MVDRSFSSGLSLQLLRLYVGDLFPNAVAKIRWEEYHTGTLYLSAFSGPVEGILMICVIYLITALHPLGQSFWSQPIVNLIPGHLALEGAQWVDKTFNIRNELQLSTLPVNVAFMIFGAFGTVGNIVNR